MVKRDKPMSKKACKMFFAAVSIVLMFAIYQIGKLNGKVRAIQKVQQELILQIERPDEYGDGNEDKI